MTNFLFYFFVFAGMYPLYGLSTYVYLLKFISYHTQVYKNSIGYAWLTGISMKKQTQSNAH